MNTNRKTWQTCACSLLLAAPATLLAAAPDAGDPLELYALDQVSYDDNLFRIPDGLAASDPTLAGIQSRDDLINRASAGLRGRWDLRRQVFGLNLRVDDVRYRDNDDLNHTGGSGSANWDWQSGRRWSGRFDGQYDRALAGYSNYRFFARDLVDSWAYGAEIRYDIGSRWRLIANGRDTTTDHSAELRQVEDFHSRSGRGAAEYRTPSGNTLAFEYRYTDADFPTVEELTGGVGRRYSERVPGLRALYALTDEVTFEGSFGYLRRDYVDPLVHDFSGGIGNALLRWKYSEKTSFELRGWHDLRSYEDAQSDYFVADGVSAGVNWQATEVLGLALLASHENQDYITDPLLLPALEPREDKVDAAQLTLNYAPRRLLSFQLQYRWARYDSSRPLNSYDDNLTRAQVRLSF